MDSVYTQEKALTSDPDYGYSDAKETRRAEVADQMDRLDRTVGMLSEVSKMIEERIAPVLAQRPNAENEVRPIHAVVTPLGTTISRIADRAENTLSGLQRLLNQIEL